MKKKTIAPILIMCILTAAVSTSLAFYAQPTKETLRNTEKSDLDINKAADNDKHMNTYDEQKQETSNQPTVDNSQEDIPKYTDNSFETDNNENSQQQPPLPMPDGRIFLNFGPPYAYTPTCTPKEPTIPLIPLEPEQ
ncbi:MAG: hypothetical protein QHH18_07610 [Candidatus Bathyarchaeota archaeon]|nr:hypothetical protein [Candidatus Bathyarchaeota archaeon A05DMB-5]MDH7558447.1 hypothetical protein [Candidatus Bathyarchaeota archaeon]